MKQPELFGGAESASRKAPAERALKPVTLITDGACIGNPGPGGWACILRHNHHTKELYGAEPRTTNNRMELTAVIEGLRALKQPCQVTVVTDSQYVKNGITQWIERWKRKGWMTKAKTPVLNKELWMALEQEVEKHDVTWEWVKGHADHADNIRADELATWAAREQLGARL
ncbi:MAG TPA: ribonuclease HI [Bryobacterales bacterium]|nr:ribonuclease HI [Bryobacterales bacterium]